MAAMSGVIACHSCDLLVDVSELENGCRANCPRCGVFLTRYQRDGIERTLAYTFAAIVLLGLANSFSFLSFAASGLESVMTLRAAPQSLWNYGMPELAVLVTVFIILLPALILVLLVLTCVPLLSGHQAPWLRTTTRAIFTLQNWAMVEVFIISVIVSLVKIAALATVTLGISFWAYVGFSITFTLALVKLDRYQCWESIDDLENRR